MRLRARSTLEAWLEFRRATLLMKCEGLDEEQLKRRAPDPSTLSLLRLVRHMTEVERGWFRRRIAGLDLGPLYYTKERPDDDFDALEDTPVADVFARYVAELDASVRCWQAFRSMMYALSTPSAGS